MKKSSTGFGKIMAVALCAGGFCRLLTAGVVYVAPTLPEGSDDSGSSWANATTNVSAACATAGAAGGGEVWLKHGYYNVIASISLASNVKVIGGFAGTETSASEADPAANPSVLGGLVHKNGAKYTPKWTCSGQTTSYEILDRTTWQLNLPPENWFSDCDRAVITAGSGGIGTVFATATGSTGSLIRGLTLYASYSYIVTVTSSTDFEIDNCLFTGCTGVKNLGVLNLHDSRFVGCATPIYSDSATETSANPSVVERCTFLYCKSGSENAVNLVSWRKGYGAIKACTFRRCWNTGSSTWFFCLLGTGSITDTLFEENTIANDGQSIYGGWGFARCVFRGTLMKQEDSTQAYHVACILTSSTKPMTGMVFENNKVTGSRASSATGTQVWTPTVARYGGSGFLTFVNCTFRNNTNEVAISDTDKSGTVIAPLSAATDGLALMNCVFENNRGPADIYAHAATSATEANQKKMTVSAINTILYSDAADYQPISCSSLLSPGFANCCISRWDAVKDAIPTGNAGYLYNITSNDPMLCEKLTKGANGAYALGLKVRSPYRKAGRGIWLATDGTYWWYDDVLTGHNWRWRNVCYKPIESGTGARLASNPPPGVNGDFTSPCVSDAFDAARKNKSIALGPANVPKRGMSIVFR